MKIVKFGFPFAAAWVVGIETIALAGIVAVNGDTTIEGGWGLFEQECPYPGLEVLVCDANLFEYVPSVPTSLGDLLFDPHHSVRAIGQGWGTWSHGYEGQVFENAGYSWGAYTMPPGAGAFDAYVEPGPFQWVSFSITGHASDGSSTMIEKEIHGYHGASHFGFYTTGGASLTLVTIDTTPPNHFAVGELRIAPANCHGDATGDWVVDVLDLLEVLAEWGQHGGSADITGDGVVDVLDLLEVLSAWGPCP